MPIWQSLGRFVYVTRLNDIFWWIIEDTIWPNRHQKNYHYNVIIIIAVVLISLFFIPVYVLGAFRVAIAPQGWYFIGREPLWRFIPESHEDSTERQKELIKEAEAALTKWWNDNELLQTIERHRRRDHRPN